jgi:hypothetical protein
MAPASRTTAAPAASIDNHDPDLSDLNIAIPSVGPARRRDLSRSISVHGMWSLP